MPPPSEPPPPTSRSRRRMLGFVAGLMLGVCLAFLGVALVVLRSLRGDLPPLTPEGFAQAQARWKDAGPASYDLDLELEGRRSGQVRVEVRDDEVTSLVRDGARPRERRTWDYWSVPGLFDMIDHDLRYVDDPVQGFGAPAGAQVVLRAEFDSRTGVPLRYQRQVLGTPLDIAWNVTRFAAVPQADGAAPSGGAPPAKE